MLFSAFPTQNHELTLYFGATPWAPGVFFFVGIWKKPPGSNFGSTKVTPPKCPVLRLMEEILHQWICSLSHSSHAFIALRWCINSRIVFLGARHFVQPLASELRLRFHKRGLRSPKTNMAGNGIPPPPIFNRKHIFIHGRFSSPPLLYVPLKHQEKTQAEYIPKGKDRIEKLIHFQV